MRVFVVPDLHGNHQALLALLKAAGIADENGNRITSFSSSFLRPKTYFPAAEIVVQIGDMINGTMSDWDNDEQTMKVANGLVDYWIMGNHDICYHYPHIVFQGFLPNPAVKSGVDRWMGSGKMVPAVVVGNTLITHAGVHEDYDFEYADDAFEAINDVWMRYSEYAFPSGGGSVNYSKDSFTFKLNRKDVQLPKGALFDAISWSRGGKSRMGGILWADWNEPKNYNFNQIVGHTPIGEGPVMTTYRGSNRYTLNIDTGVKSGLNPTGVWINDDGTVDEFVSAIIPKEGEENDKAK